MDVATSRPRGLRGITLIELITTLAVAGISLAILLPGWGQLTERSQVGTAANELLHQLRFARSAAVARGKAVSLCPSDDGSSCSGDPAGWQRGYLIFVDADRDRARSADEVLLRSQGSLRPGLQLHSTAGRPAIRFSADGAAWGTNTTFSVCLGDDPAVNRAVVLYGSGRARVDRRTPRGDPVTCT
jgi:type IV fimbrial biogenesis protein FimT